MKEYIDLTPYYEMGFERRLLIRNCTSAEQLIGYDIDCDNKSQKER